MHLNELYHHIIALGWWGLALAILLVLLASVATYLLQRRTAGTQGHGLDWSGIAMGFLSTILLLLSGLWSGWAKYMDYHDAAPGKAWAVAAGFVICGLTLSVILQFCSKIAIRESHTSRWVAVWAMLCFSIFWLGISPLQNARFLCQQEAVQSAIEERFEMLDSYSQPIVEDYTVSRRKIIPIFTTIHKALVDMKEEQENELGGCGPICRAYEQQADLLLPTVNRLYTTYDPDDPEKDYYHKVLQLRHDITTLINSKDYTPEELKNQFYGLASDWVSILEIISMADSPVPALRQALRSLENLLDYLRSYRKTHANSEIRRIAVNKALSTLEPLVNDLKLTFMEQQQKPEQRLVSLQHSVTFANKPTGGSFNLASIASIRMNTSLMRKYIDKIWPEALLAFFIDIAGMAFVCVPMLVVLFRGRHVQSAMDLVRRKKIQLRKAEQRLEEQKKQCQKLQDKIRACNGQAKRALEKLVAEKNKEIKRIHDQFKIQKDALLTREQAIRQEQRTALAKLGDEERQALAKAASAKEELVLKGRYAIYRDNVLDRYRDELTQVEQEIASLEQDQQNRLEEINRDFARKEKACQEKFSPRMQKLEKRFTTGKEKVVRLETALDQIRQELAEAETRLANVQEGFSSNNK